MQSTTHHHKTEILNENYEEQETEKVMLAVKDTTSHDRNEG